MPRKACPGVHRTVKGDRTLVYLMTAPYGVEAQKFIAQAMELAPSLRSISYEERVTAMIGMLNELPKVCSLCGTGAD